jgi:hypothetical protein
MARKKSTITTNNGSEYQTYDLNLLKGVGNAGRYAREVTAVLMELRPYVGPKPMYEFKLDDGRTIQRPQTWTAVFSDGSMFDWTVFLNEETGELRPWDQFDPSIDLEYCKQNNIPIHVWRDERKRMHLELAVSEETTQQSVQQQAPQYQQQAPQYQQQYYQPQPQQQYYPQQQGNWRQPNQNYGAPF